MVKANDAPALYGLKIGKVVVTIVGTSPLLVNRFPETAIDAIEAAHLRPYQAMVVRRIAQECVTAALHYIATMRQLEAESGQAIG